MRVKPTGSLAWQASATAGESTRAGSSPSCRHPKELSRQTRLGPIFRLNCWSAHAKFLDSVYPLNKVASISDQNVTAWLLHQQCFCLTQCALKRIAFRAAI